MQLDKAKAAFHKASRKEQVAKDRESHAQGNPDVAIEKQRKIQEEREVARAETEKVRTVAKSGKDEEWLSDWVRER